jgi:hypothetical protein
MFERELIILESILFSTRLGTALNDLQCDHQSGLVSLIVDYDEASVSCQS